MNENIFTTIVATGSYIPLQKVPNIEIFNISEVEIWRVVGSLLPTLEAVFGVPTCHKRGKKCPLRGSERLPRRLEMGLKWPKMA